MRATNPTLADWIDANADRPLLNPGLVGGAARDVERFAAQCGQPRRDLTDMGAANQIAYSAFPDHVTGSWHTPYRAFTYVEGAWWKHK